jgi:hypothetical protein
MDEKGCVHMRERERHTERQTDRDSARKKYWSSKIHKVVKLVWELALKICFFSVSNEWKWKRLGIWIRSMWVDWDDHERFYGANDT